MDIFFIKFTILEMSELAKDEEIAKIVKELN